MGRPEVWIPPKCIVGILNASQTDWIHFPNPYIWNHSSLVLVPHRNTNCQYALPALNVSAGLWITPPRREDSACLLVHVGYKQRGRAAREHNNGAISAEKCPLPVKCFHGRPHVAPSWLELLSKRILECVLHQSVCFTFLNNTATACKDGRANGDC